MDTEVLRDGSVHREIERIPVGRRPGEPISETDGDRWFVATNETDDVSVLDVSTRRELDRYETDLHPDGIAYLES